VGIHHRDTEIAEQEGFLVFLCASVVRISYVARSEAAEREITTETQRSQSRNAFSSSSSVPPW